MQKMRFHVLNTARMNYYKPVPFMGPKSLNCDSFEPLSKRLKDWRKGKFLWIGVVTAPVHGAGDLVYGIKFVKTLMDRYKEFPIGVCLLVPDAKDHYLTMTSDRLNEYKPKLQPSKDGNLGKLNIYVTHRKSFEDPPESPDVLDTPIPIHILFIAPGTNQKYIEIDAPHLPNEAIYLMSEYNTNNKLNQDAAVRINEVTINAGVYDPDDCLKLSEGEWWSTHNTCAAGIFITEDKDYPRLVKGGQHKGKGKAEHYFIPRSKYGKKKMRPYTVSYVYTGEDDLRNMYKSSEERPTSELLDKFEHEKRVQEGSQNIYGTGKHKDSSCVLRSDTREGRLWRQSMMVMAKCFYTFLKNVKSYKDLHQIEEPIIVYVNKVSFLTDFRKFVVLEDQSRTLIGTLWDWLDSPKSPFEFAIYPNLPVNEFLGFCQHAIPISFLSGDNSVAEFISVNRNPILKIVYQTFYWKRALAKALGVELEGNRLDTCGMATIDRGKFLRNVGNNFGITGMAQVESLLARALKEDGKITCENTDRRTIGARLLDSNHFVYKVAYDWGKRTLQFTMKDNSFNTNLITGDHRTIKKGVDLWAWSKKSPKNLFVKSIQSEVKFSGNPCKNFGLNLDLQNNKGKHLLKNVWIDLNQHRDEHLPNGWERVKSISRPGKFSYLNKYTREKIPWIPNSKASTKPNKFPPDQRVRINQVPGCLNAVIANNYINQVIAKKKWLQEMLVYTYATVANDCGGLRKVKKNHLGMFIFQEYIPSTDTLAQLLEKGYEYSDTFAKRRGRATVQLAKLFAQLYDVLWSLQNFELPNKAQMKLVHNDLWGANILVEKLAKPKKYEINKTSFVCEYSVRVIDFDEAAMNIRKDLRVVSIGGWEHKCKEFRDYYDFAYLLADMYTLLGNFKSSYKVENSYIEEIKGDLLYFVTRCLAILFKVRTSENVNLEANRLQKQTERVLTQKEDGTWMPPTTQEVNGKRPDFAELGKFLEKYIQKHSI